MSTIKAAAKKTFNLDALLSPDEAAPWLGVARRTLMDWYRAGKVPGVKVGERVVRFHPRSVLESLK